MYGTKSDMTVRVKTCVWHSVTLCTEAAGHFSTVVVILCVIKYSQSFTLNALKFKHEH